jgi:hypothetical protein
LTACAGAQGRRRLVWPTGWSQYWPRCRLLHCFLKAHGGDHILQSGHTAAGRGSYMLPCWGRSNVLMRPNFLSKTVWRARLEMLSKRVALNPEPPRNSMSSKLWNSELTQLLLGAHARPKGRFLDRSRKRSGNPMLRQIGCLKAAATISA